MSTRVLITSTSAEERGVNVHYCAEQFQNDGSPISTLIKSVKRTMAGEYSRELSVKVFAGQCRLISPATLRSATSAETCGMPIGFGAEFTNFG